MTLNRSLFVLAAAVTLSCSSLQAANLFPVKSYAKPDEPVAIKFVNEKGEEAKKALAALGADAGKLDNLFTPAPAADIAGADGAATFKIYSAMGEEQKLEKVTPGADGVVDLAAAFPKIRDGGTFYVIWKDAAPLVVETLYNPGRNPGDLARRGVRMENLTAAQKTQVAATYSPAVTHIEMASYALITTDKGVIKAKFSYDLAPHTVDNFIALSRQGFYDNSAFHRIISGFMIQGGDSYANSPDPKPGTGGPGYDITDELTDKKHIRGVLSMANSGSPNTSGSQFFIMHGNNPGLDGRYNAFGDVLEGMDVVDTIAKTPSEAESGKVTGAKPKIISIQILPATPDMYVKK